MEPTHTSQMPREDAHFFFKSNAFVVVSMHEQLPLQVSSWYTYHTYESLIFETQIMLRSLSANNE